MKISACQPYHAVLSGQGLLRMPDGRSVFKLYALSITGRDHPERYEWQYSPLSLVDFEHAFLSSNFEGVGFVTAFPQITKVFRFSPYKETVLDVSELCTADLQPWDVTRGDGTHEFACYAEAILAADEYEIWANAATIEAYLASCCSRILFPITNHQKLADYAAGLGK